MRQIFLITGILVIEFRPQRSMYHNVLLGHILYSLTRTTWGFCLTVTDLACRAHESYAVREQPMKLIEKRAH